MLAGKSKDLRYREASRKSCKPLLTLYETHHAFRIHCFSCGVLFLYWHSFFERRKISVFNSAFLYSVTNEVPSVDKVQTSHGEVTEENEQW